MNTPDDRLPGSWTAATLGDTCQIMSGYGFPRELQGRRSGDVPFYKVADISDAWKANIKYLSTAVHYISAAEALSIGRELPAGSTVFAKIGAAIALNRRAVLNRSALVDNNVMGLFPESRLLDRGFLYHYVCTLKLDDLSRATTVPSIRKSDVADLAVPVPPLPEQERIVAEIEAHFTRLDAAIAALESAQAKLKRYGASVLKAACEGRLVTTEAELARSEGRSYEPASVLLGRVLRARRAKWEQDQLAKMRAAGKQPKDGRWKAKYKEPVELKADGLPELADGWAWATMSQLVLRSEYGTSVKCDYYADGPPVLRIPNIAGGTIDLTDIKHATRALSLADDDWLRPGDLLMCRTNGSISLIGKTALVTKALDPPHTFASYLLRFRLIESLAHWADTVLGSPFGRSFIERNAASSAGQHNVSLSLIHGMYVPLPPAKEIQSIIAEKDRRLSVLSELEVSIDHTLRRASRLRQSILKRAFEGKLVPQDPDDEPAIVLLERIRTERKEEAPQAIPRRKRRAGRKTT